MSRQRDKEKRRKAWTRINLVMATTDDLSRGMELATSFEDRHGGKPPMYFRRLLASNAVSIIVLTDRDKKHLRKCFSDMPVHSVSVEPLKAGDADICSWEYCHAYQAAKHLIAKMPRDIMRVSHAIHDMCNYSTSQALRNYIDAAACCATATIKHPTQV